MEEYFIAISKTYKRTAYAALLLKGAALSWWKNLRLRGAAPTNWKDFSEQLIKRFEPVDAIRTARAKIDKLTQTTSVQNYIAQFSELHLQIPNMQEEEAFHTFRRGLKWQVRNAMDEREITQDLATLQRQAQRWDDIHFGLERRPDFKKPFDYKKRDGTRPRISQVDAKEITCFHCGQKGHYAKECKSNPNGKAKFKKTHWKDKTYGRSGKTEQSSLHLTWSLSIRLETPTSQQSTPQAIHWSYPSTRQKARSRVRSIPKQVRRNPSLLSRQDPYWKKVCNQQRPIWGYQGKKQCQTSRSVHQWSHRLRLHWRSLPHCLQWHIKDSHLSSRRKCFSPDDHQDLPEGDMPRSSRTPNHHSNRRIWLNQHQDHHL